MSPVDTDSPDTSITVTPADRSAATLELSAAAEVTTTFSSTYARVISLAQVLDPDVIAVYANLLTASQHHLTAFGG